MKVYHKYFALEKVIQIVNIKEIQEAFLNTQIILKMHRTQVLVLYQE